MASCNKSTKTLPGSPRTQNFTRGWKPGQRATLHSHEKRNEPQCDSSPQSHKRSARATVHSSGNKPPSPESCEVLEHTLISMPLKTLPL